MFAWLKSWFSKSSSAPSTSPEEDIRDKTLAAPQALATPAPLPAMPATAPQSPPHGGNGLTPRMPAAAPQAAPAISQPRAAVAGPAPGLSLPLNQLVARLPAIFQAKILHPPRADAAVSLPLARVLEQISRGAVKITFGELRRASPPGVFADLNKDDAALVSLPLDLILSRLKPEQLSRRSGQRKVALPEEITEVFAPSGKTLTQPAAAEVNLSQPKAANPPLQRLAPTSAPPPPAPPTQIPAAAPSRPEASAAVRVKPITQEPHAPVATPTASRPLPVVLAPPVAAPIPAAPSPVVPPPEPEAAAPQPMATIAFSAAPPNAAPEPMPTIAFSAAPSRPPVPVPSKPMAPPFSHPSTHPTQAPPPVTAAPDSPNLHVSAPMLDEEGVLTIPIVSLMAGWPEALRLELGRIQAVSNVVHLPLPEVEQSLKRGKLTFAWNQLSGWIHPPVQISLEGLDGQTQLALPLGAVIPLFLARRKAAAPQKRITVSSDIPDVFAAATPAAPPSSQPSAAEAKIPGRSSPPIPAQGPAVDSVTPIAPHPPVAGSPATSIPAAAQIPSAAPGLKLAPAVAPISATSAATGGKLPFAVPPSHAAVSATAHPAAAPLPTPGSAVPGTHPKEIAGKESAPPDLGTLFGQPTKRVWTPVEIVQRTGNLPGASGALIALQDGLLVAHSLPDSMNAEMLAAFLPQMFGRMGHYTKELSLGEPSVLALVINKQPLQIARVGNVFLLVLGRVGEALPSAHLEAVSAYLERQSK